MPSKAKYYAKYVRAEYKIFGIVEAYSKKQARLIFYISRLKPVFPASKYRKFEPYISVQKI